MNRPLCFVSLVLLSLCFGLATSGEDAPEHLIINKSTHWDGKEIVFECSIRPHLREIELPGRVIKDTGTILEVRTLQSSSPARIGPIKTNVIWRLFVVDVQGPGKKWTGDLVVDASRKEVFLALSTGTGFGIHRIPFEGEAEVIPQRVVADSIHRISPPSNDDLKISPTTEMLTQQLPVEKIGISQTNSDLIVETIVNAHVQRFKYSLTRMEWTSSPYAEERRKKMEREALPKKAPPFPLEGPFKNLSPRQP